MSVNSLKQNILHVHEVYGLRKWFLIIYLLADLKQPPSHPIWIEHLTKKAISDIFRFANAPPHPTLLRREWWKFAQERLQPSKIFLVLSNYIVQQHFFTTYCKEYQLFIQTTNCIIMANLKTVDRFYCKKRETLTDFKFFLCFYIIRLGSSNSFLSDRFFSLLFFLSFL